MSALTDAVVAVPPRWGHLVARLLRCPAAYAMFCPHCPNVALWADTTGATTSQESQP